MFASTAAPQPAAGADNSASSGVDIRLQLARDHAMLPVQVRRLNCSSLCACLAVCAQIA